MTLTLANPADTYVKQAKSTTNYATSTTLLVSARSSNIGYGLVQFSGIPAGSDVVIASAHLRMFAKGTWSSTSIVAEQITGTWSVSKVTYAKSPAVTATNAVTVTQTAVEGTVFDFDITAIVQLWAAGTTNLGIRLRSTSTTDQSFYAAEASGSAATFKPVLVIEWSRPPTAPASLNPTNNQQVSIANPTLTFKHGDPAGLAMNAYQLQTNATNVWTSPTFDSGTVSTSVQQHTLAAALTNGQTIWWRVRTRNTANQWGPYSDGQQFGRTAKSTVTITIPAVSPNDFVQELTPPFAATFSGTPTSWEMLNYSVADPNTIGWDSGIQTGTIAYTSLTPISVDGTGHSQIEVRVWDGVDRATTPGDPPYAVATRPFTYAASATVTPFAALTLVTPTVVPLRTWTFTRATPPDSITIQRSDGKVWTDLAPADLFVSGTTYQWTETTAPPHTSLTYKFDAVVNGVASSGSPVSATVNISPLFAWLLDPTNSSWALPIQGADQGSWGMGEESTVHEIRGASQVVIITEALRGYEGNFSGQFNPTPQANGLTSQQTRDLAWALKQNPTKVWRFVVADLNIPVVLRNVVVAPVRAAELIYNISFDFYQVGEIPWS